MSEVYTGLSQKGIQMSESYVRYKISNYYDSKIVQLEEADMSNKGIEVKRETD